MNNNKKKTQNSSIAETKDKFQQKCYSLTEFRLLSSYVNEIDCFDFDIDLQIHEIDSWVSLKFKLKQEINT